MAKPLTIRHINRQLIPAYEHATNNGWTVFLTGGGHLRFDKQGRQSVFSSSSPSCPFAHKKIIADMVRRDKATA